MTQTIPAIETLYAGCRFRSRLEARWAVFFDHLGIRWEYEPQGFELTWRLRLTNDTLMYLPDFRLPDLGLWVEVKGEWSAEECDRFCNAAADLSSPGSGCGGGSGDVLLLGPVPRPDVPWSPWLLHMHKGDLLAIEWADGSTGCYGRGGRPIATDWGGDDYYHGPLDLWCGVLLEGSLYDFRYSQALTAARSARFEHGESGAGGRR